MDSYTLRFRKIPRLALFLLATAILAWVLSAIYTIWLNPEMAFWKHAFRLKEDWQREMRVQFGTNIVVCGGSSCFTGVDAKYIQTKYSLPIVNQGFHAGMGPMVLGRLARKHLKPGDTLILAFEPDLLDRSFEIPALGNQFSLVVDSLDTFGNLPLSQAPSALLAFRPGGYHVFTLLGKFILRKPLYRYSNSEVQVGGWQAVVDRRDVQPSIPVRYHLSEDAKVFFRETAQWCAVNKVRLACTLPWMFHSKEDAERVRINFRSLLAEINVYMPVLRDPFLGCHSEREDFADTNLHLVPDAAKKRSDELARELINWDVYQTGDLSR
jgi:hypothetical protein